MTDTVGQPIHESAEMEQGARKAKLAQDVLLIGLFKNVDSRAVLTDALKRLKFDELDYAKAFGSLMHNGYVSASEITSKGRPPGVVGFELTELGYKRVEEDSVLIEEVYAMIEEIQATNDAFQKRKNRIFTLTALNSAELTVDGVRVIV